MHIQSRAHRKETGVVHKKTIGMYLINVNGREVSCELSPRLRKELVYPTADPSSLSHIVVAVRDVRKAVEAGIISERRYDSFLRMKEEL